MPDIEEEIFTRLNGHTPLTDIIGVNNIFPLVKELDPTLPGITYFRVSTERFPAFDITPKNVAARFQFSIWALTFAQTRAIKDVFIPRIQRWRQDGPPKVEDAFIIGENDFFEDDRQQYQLAIDVKINYIET